MRVLMTSIPRLNPDVGVQRVGGRLLAAGPGEHLHTFEDDAGEVSEVAERIVELCDGQRSVARIVDLLCEEFEVDRETCTRETAAFVELLADKKVLDLG